jgi:secreted trypsin-like serine protease
MSYLPNIEISLTLFNLLVATSAWANVGEAPADESVESSWEEVVQGGQPGESAVARSTFPLEVSASLTPGVKLPSCSGTLIGSDIILTAAHCINNKSVSGMAIRVQGKDGSYRRIEVAAGIVHPKFQEYKEKGALVIRNDVAVLRLKEAVPGGQPALLPREDFRLADGSTVLAAGFGLSEKTITIEEMMANPLVQEIRCRLAMPSILPEEKMMLIHQIYTLAAQRPLLQGELKVALNDHQHGSLPTLKLQGKQMICSGDSGGPSYLKSKDRLVVIGVHSTSTMSDALCQDPAKELSTWDKWMKGIPDHFATDLYVPFYVAWIRESAAKLKRTEDI